MQCQNIHHGTLIKSSATYKYNVNDDTHPYSFDSNSKTSRPNTLFDTASTIF